MSEAKSSKKKAPKAKTETAPEAESKSESAAPEGAAPKAAESADSKPSTEAASSDAKSSDSARDGAKESGKDAGKSARESAGGKSDVHYGYFSSVRTPEYRSGWDAIWGGKNGDNVVGGDNDDETPRQRRAAARTSRPAKARKRRDPVTVTLDLDDLPPALRQGLVEIASARFKESRVSYARRDKAGAIDWRITCRAD